MMITCKLGNIKVRIKTLDGKEFDVYKFLTLENGDVEITIKNKG